MQFKLAEKLKSDSLLVADLTLSQLRLSANAAYPWVLLIPRRDGMVEMIDLMPADQHQLWQEITLVSQLIKRLFKPDKLNVAALGNVVSQLHVHIIARYRHDPAWPQPVWGIEVEQNQPATLPQQRIRLLQDALSALGVIL